MESINIIIIIYTWDRSYPYVYMSIYMYICMYQLTCASFQKFLFGGN